MVLARGKRRIGPGSSKELVIRCRRDERIMVPSTYRERRMAVRYSDWARLRRRLCRNRGSLEGLRVVYSILFGVAAASGLSIIPIAASQDLASWVTWLYICICASSFLCATVFVWVDARVRAGMGVEAQSIVAEMNEIEGMFDARDRSGEPDSTQAESELN